MWPPMLMLGMLNVNTRLMITKKPICDARSSRPRFLAMMKAAAIRPNTAPDAPTVNSSGSRSSAPNDPPSSETQ